MPRCDAVRSSVLGNCRAFVCTLRGAFGDARFFFTPRSYVVKNAVCGNKVRSRRVGSLHQNPGCGGTSVDGAGSRILNYFPFERIWRNAHLLPTCAPSCKAWWAGWRKSRGRHTNSRLVRSPIGAKFFCRLSLRTSGCCGCRGNSGTKRRMASGKRCLFPSGRSCEPLGRKHFTPRRKDAKRDSRRTS
jgi:hypothetical protein